MAGPLHDVIVTEMAGLGPAPFCGMVLADLGATVWRFERTGRSGLFSNAVHDVPNRGKQSVAVDLKQDGGQEVVLRAAAVSEILIEGFRPGVMERLGVGPAQCLARNSSLVYGRMTGWGQTGPLAERAGHDIDYIALSGVLHAVGPAERPVPPLNLVADYGGGGMLLAVGVLAALAHARATGEGQVVDAAMVDGSALLTASHHGLIADGWWVPQRESNLLDGAAPFYTVYEAADGGHVAVGALEPQFFAALLEGLDIDATEIGAQNDRESWPAMRRLFAERFATRTRDEWAAHFSGRDACVAPVLSLIEAPDHPHNRERGTFVEIGGATQPGPAPRFGLTETGLPEPPEPVGASTDSVLQRLGFSQVEISRLRSTGAVS